MHGGGGVGGRLPLCIKSENPKRKGFKTWATGVAYNQWKQLWCICSIQANDIIDNDKLNSSVLNHFHSKDCHNPYCNQFYFMTSSHFNTDVPYLKLPWSATFHWKLMTSDHDVFKMFDGILKKAPLCIMLEDRPIWKQRVHAQVLLFYWSQAMHVTLHLRQLFWKSRSCCVIYCWP